MTLLSVLKHKKIGELIEKFRFIGVCLIYVHRQLTLQVIVIPGEFSEEDTVSRAGTSVSIVPAKTT